MPRWGAGRAVIAMTAVALAAAACDGQAARLGAQGPARGQSHSSTPPHDGSTPPPMTVGAAPSASGPVPPSSSPSPSPSPSRIVKTMAVLAKPVAVRSRVNFAVTLPTTLRTASPCRLTQLTVVPRVGAAAGSIFGALQIHNISRSTCVLAGGPSLALVTADGVVFASTGSTAPATGGSTVVLLPDSWATTTPWGLGGSCGGQGKTATLQIGIPMDGAGLSIPLPNGSDTMPAACSGVGKALRARPHPGEMTAPSFAPIDHVDNYATWDLATVTPSLEVPSTVRAGTDLLYVVVLSHPAGSGLKGGDGDIGFVGDEDAPLYRQQFGGESSPSYQMNWGPLLILHADEGVAFRMRMHVPAETPPGPTTLTWQFVEPQMRALTTTVTVLAH